MASVSFVAILVLSSLCFHGVLGEVICENLPEDKCAFAISSSGRRCVLETSTGNHKSDDIEYQCRTSEVVVERMAGHIESDECIKACGVNRNSVGISSDSLLEAEFMRKLCSSACFNNCPNIVDLYMNLAAGEGASLNKLCSAGRSNPRRSMAEIMSAGVSSDGFDTAPAPSPV